ncbi:DUF6058 family natural product biosynthesis protein [Roseivirga sp. E12]|uniref:DUF6058 family natural product biosynthesis protein n=1 Tax=Roseivirga sp. E12 TaxID=2819237 RepID=UPI001ABC62FA|nr:DUF6058 family natural product biosynthesis protein [Roseivirga sp. E12]MBO3696840.1 hypothetical protein [Roseivirga sp. E12]
MDINLKYIQENYIEKKALCEATNISSEELDILITMELIPSASYSIDSRHEISSPLGDKIVINDPKEYFPQNTPALIEKNKGLTGSPTSFKALIKQEFLTSFESDEDKRYAYGNIIDKAGKIDKAKMDNAFEIEWDYYCKGIYGICTLNATGSDIIKKEIAVKKLIEFNQKHSECELSEDDKSTLEDLSKQYNEVSNLFAPYQRETSSRGKYLDKILRENGMAHLIKK